MSLVGFRVLGFVGASGVAHSINKTLSHQQGSNSHPEGLRHCSGLGQTARHAPPPRTSTSPLPRDKSQSTVHTCTNDPQCSKARETPAVQATRRNANSELRPGTGQGTRAGAGPQRRATRQDDDVYVYEAYEIIKKNWQTL